MAVPVLVVLVLVGAPPGPVVGPSGASVPEAPVSPAPSGNVVLGVGGRDGDCSGRRSDGTGDG
ncbi:hypothetical protein AB0O39_19135 [Streptomyces anulatus]|uniref:hypothetical protein n=1 Tax=Streptomyces anulatus TaxID=1892 RepID=UPI00342EE5D1